MEFSVRGTPTDISAMRAAFLELSREQGIDIGFQEDNAFRRIRRLVCFDMDSTLIQAEVIDELAKRAGAGEQVAAITEAAMRGELDFSQSLRKRVSLLEGLPESVLEDVKCTWKFWLSRRSHKGAIDWEKFNKLLKRFPLPKPRIIHQV